MQFFGNLIDEKTLIVINAIVIVIVIFYKIHKENGIKYKNNLGTFQLL